MDDLVAGSEPTDPMSGEFPPCRKPDEMIIHEVMNHPKSLRYARLDLRILSRGAVNRIFSESIEEQIHCEALNVCGIASHWLHDGS